MRNDTKAKPTRPPFLAGSVAVMAVACTAAAFPEPAALFPTSQPTDGALAAPFVEPRADEILRSMGEYVGSANEFVFRADITFDEVVLGGVKVQYEASLDVGVRRPDRVYLEYADDRVGHRFWYDGSTATLYSEAQNMYSTRQASSLIDDVLDQLSGGYGMTLPLSDFLYANPYQRMSREVVFGSYLGRHFVDGVRCHHLVFVQEQIDWQIWIEDGKQSVPRKLVITYKSEPDAPQYVARLNDWDFAPRLSDRLFVADPPLDARRIEALPATEAFPGQ